MSFLTCVTPLTTQLASSVARTTAPAFTVPAFRSLSSTTKKDKGVADATKDTLKKAERSASDAALKGIETGEHVRDKVKGTFGSTTEEAEAKSGEVKDEASKYAQEGKAKAEAKSGEVKNEASKYAQEGKAKTGEAVNEAKHKVHEATR